MMEVTWSTESQAGLCWFGVGVAEADYVAVSIEDDHYANPGFLRLKIMELLSSTTMSVSDICYSLGFENPTHFLHIFKYSKKPCDRKNGIRQRVPFFLNMFIFHVRPSSRLF